MAIDRPNLRRIAFNLSLSGHVTPASIDASDQSRGESLSERTTPCKNPESEPREARLVRPSR